MVPSRLNSNFAKRLSFANLFQSKGRYISLGNAAGISPFPWVDSVRAELPQQNTQNNTSSFPLSGNQTQSNSKDVKDEILDAALRYVGPFGWSKEAIARGAQDLGLPPAAAGVFENGAVELAWHVMKKANEHMSYELESANLADMSVNDRIKFGIKTRLLFQQPYMSKWAEAMALGASPSSIAKTLELLAVMSDEIWHWAGDRSVSLDWYTRRSLLLGVFSVTEAFMLTDRSPNYEDTWSFLDKRLREVSSFGKAADSGVSIFGLVTSGIGSLATTAFEFLKPQKGINPIAPLQKVASTIQKATSLNAPGFTPETVVTGEYVFSDREGNRVSDSSAPSSTSPLQSTSSGFLDSPFVANTVNNTFSSAHSAGNAIGSFARSFGISPPSVATYTSPVFNKKN